MEEKDEKTFCEAYAKCKNYPNDVLVEETPEDFDYIWEYIQQSKSLYYLGLLRRVVPLGMLKYRLQERIKYLSSIES